MQETIDKIIKKLQQQIGAINKVEKINVGFTNTLYLLDNKFILKVCTKEDNESDFKNEIDFYLENKDNSYIPNLISYSADKSDIEYYYEVMEKVEGVSLYNVWHTFNEEQRKDIVRQLCELMKEFHSHKKEPFNWSCYIDNEIQLHLEKAMEIGYFNVDELEIINQARQLFPKYLESNNFVFVHNDIHFDNIIYNNGKIKIIDFERSMAAPRDYELDIFFRMVRMPWKYASEETEQYTNSSDYAMIPTYVSEYYSELLNVPFLEQRLAIYDILDFIEKSYEYPNEKEIKDNIMNAVKIVLFKETLTFDKITTPIELLQFMTMNMKYGWIGLDNSKHVGNLKNFRQQYRTSTTQEILETGLGTCIESANLAKSWFENQGIENKLYCHRTYENEDNFDSDVKMHIIIVFKENDKWYHFEHSNYQKKGIHEYSNVNEALEDITKGFKENGDIRELTEIDTIPTGMSFKDFNNHVNGFDTINISNGKKL